MNRPHDIGGTEGHGSIPIEPDAHPFHHEWEARVFALNRLFLSRGTYSLDEFRDAVERMNADEYERASYYERWLYAIEKLVEEKGVLSA